MVQRITIFLAIALGLSTVGAPSVRAELTWASKTLELHGRPGVTELEGRFRFTNSGSTPVDIRQIQSSCGCATAELAQRHFEPGQSGEIVARYTVGTHVGLQSKIIAVSSTGQSQPTLLTLEVHLAEVVHLDPAHLVWEHGETPGPKVMTLELVAPGALEDLEVHSLNGGVRVQVRPITPGRKYALVVTPPGTRDSGASELVIDYRLADRQAAPVRTYALIKPPPATK